MKDKIKIIRESAEHIYSSIIGFVYPPQCVICDDLHENDKFFICRRCERGLNFYAAPFCFKCKNIIDYDAGRCPTCGGGKVISRAWACGSYDEYFRPMIHAFKYAGIIPAGKLLAHKLGEMMRDACGECDFDMIVPIPLHPVRQRRRGFNQSLIISNCLQKELNIPVFNDALVRIRRTKDQTGLNRQRRTDNMRGAFVANVDFNFRGKRIMLVDDVTTSGATAGEAARILKEAGTREIQLAVLSLAGHDSDESKF